MRFVPKQRKWNAVETLFPLKNRIHIASSDRTDFENEIWNDLKSEYDSKHFYRHVLERSPGLTSDFRAFLDAWRADEQNHANGFLWLYQECFGLDSKQIHRRLEREKSDFSKLQWFFEDEFRLCLLIAYDELATTVSYHLDRPFYEKIGGLCLEAWIAGVKADEALHLANLMGVIAKNHRDRIIQSRDILDKILDLDLNQGNYSGTFVLDHTGSPFSSEMLRGCADRIVRKLEAVA